MRLEIANNSLVKGLKGFLLTFSKDLFSILVMSEIECVQETSETEKTAILSRFVPIWAYLQNPIINNLGK